MAPRRTQEALCRLTHQGGFTERSAAAALALIVFTAQNGVVRLRCDTVYCAVGLTALCAKNRVIKQLSALGVNDNGAFGVLDMDSLSHIYQPYFSLHLIEYEHKTPGKVSPEKLLPNTVFGSYFHILHTSLVKLYMS